MSHAIRPPSLSQMPTVRLPKPSSAGWPSLQAAWRQAESKSVDSVNRWDIRSVGNDANTVRPSKRDDR